MKILKRNRFDCRNESTLIVLIAISLLYIMVTITALYPFDCLQIVAAATLQENNNPKPVFLSTISTVIATGAGATGAILTVPGYLRARKQPKFLATYLLKIHNKYDELCRYPKFIDKSKNEYRNFLDSLRCDIIYSLKNGDINENQYRLIEDRIAEYLNRLNCPKQK
jgi:hypothetical protein